MRRSGVRIPRGQKIVVFSLFDPLIPSTQWGLSGFYTEDEPVTSIIDPISLVMKLYLTMQRTVKHCKATECDTIVYQRKDIFE